MQFRNEISRVSAAHIHISRQRCIPFFNKDIPTGPSFIMHRPFVFKER